VGVRVMAATALTALWGDGARNGFLAGAPHIGVNG
jgi:hypothetical protein